MMNYTLSTHPMGYSIRPKDVVFSSVTLLTGAPYAKRHFQLANQENQKFAWGHRIIAVIQSIPLVGLIAAVLERMIVLAFNRFQASPPVQSTKKPKKTVRLNDELYIRIIPANPETLTVT